MAAVKSAYRCEVERECHECRALTVHFWYGRHTDWIEVPVCWDHAAL